MNTNQARTYIELYHTVEGCAQRLAHGKPDEIDRLQQEYEIALARLKELSGILIRQELLWRAEQVLAL